MKAAQPRLVLLGAGGFGREVHQWACDAWRLGRRGGWRFGGFLDDGDVADPLLPGPVVGRIATYVPRRGDVFLCAIGDPAARQRTTQRLVEVGARFATLVHPTAVVGRNVELGAGVILCPRVILTCDIRVGDHTALNCGTAVGHDARLGRWCQVSSFCDITGRCEVGDGVFLGSRVSLLPGARVGDGASVGAGSVVLRRVGPGERVFGVPATRIAV